MEKHSREGLNKQVTAVKKYWPIVKTMIQVQNDTGAVKPEVLKPDDLDWVVDVDYMLSSGVSDLFDVITEIGKALNVAESKDLIMSVVITITALRKLGFNDFTNRSELKMSPLRGIPALPEAPKGFYIVEAGNKILKGDLCYDPLDSNWVPLSTSSEGVIIDESTTLIARAARDNLTPVANQIADMLMDELSKAR